VNVPSVANSIWLSARLSTAASVTPGPGPGPAGSKPSRPHPAATIHHIDRTPRSYRKSARCWPVGTDVEPRGRVVTRPHRVRLIAGDVRLEHFGDGLVVVPDPRRVVVENALGMAIERSAPVSIELLARGVEHRVELGVGVEGIVGRVVAR